MNKFSNNVLEQLESNPTLVNDLEKFSEGNKLTSVNFGKESDLENISEMNQFKSVTYSAAVPTYATGVSKSNQTIDIMSSTKEINSGRINTKVVFDMTLLNMVSIITSSTLPNKAFAFWFEKGITIKLESIGLDRDIEQVANDYLVVNADEISKFINA